MKKKECVICGDPIQIILVIDDIEVNLCELHFAEYFYKPDNFLRRHGLNKENKKMLTVLINRNNHKLKC